MSSLHAGSAARVLDTATGAGAEYVDVQFWNIRQQQMGVRDGVVRDVSDTSSLGYGVRALYQGSWGFAGSDRFEDAGLDSAASLAVEIAKSSAQISGRIRAVKPTERYIDTWSTPVKIDPLSVPLSKRADYLLAATHAAHVAKNIISSSASMVFWITEKEFYSSNGSAIQQRIVQSGARIGALATGRDGDVQDRHGPGDTGLYQSGGYEIVERADLVNWADKYGHEVSQLADAPVLPSMTTTMILPSQVLMLQMHESIGHPLELDRALTWEANFSGISWAKADKVGSLRYGSDLLTVYCDNTLALGFATVGYDDEGTKSQPITLIENGILRAYLSSRDTAAELNLPRTASVRAQDWANVPMVRITNIALAPREGTLESIIAETKDGILMDGIRSWSIDDHRLNFQFGPQVAYEIKNGKRGRMFKKPTYTGVTPIFWGSMDRVAGAQEFTVWGTPNCGKGEPGQIGRTCQACSHARFQNVQVGVRAND